jgi:hypothetical protein
MGRFDLSGNFDHIIRLKMPMQVQTDDSRKVLLSEERR